MKLQKLFLALLASAAIFIGCENEEEDSTLPSLNVSLSELVFDQTGGTWAFTVTSNRDWTVSTDADWLAFNPSAGSASKALATVNVTALANEGQNREATITVGSQFDKRTITVTQPGAKGEDMTNKPSGDGSLENPFNPAGAVAYVNTLDADVESSSVIYITGIVSSVSMTFEGSGTYGNANFYISGDGSTSSTQFYVFQTYYLGNKMWTSGQTDVKVGDEVVICGKVVNFRGNTAETVGKGGSYIYSLNGETKAPDVDYSKYELLTVKSFIEKASTSQYYRLKGTVSRFNSTYCSFDLTDESGKIYVFSVANREEWDDKISNGGTVELAGLYSYYEKNSQHEVVNAQILSFEAGSQSGGAEAKGSGTLEDPYNPAGANAAASKLKWTNKNTYESSDDVYVKGKISRIVDKGTFTESGTYGNATFYISEDGQASDEFYAYHILYLGNKKFSNGQTDIKEGDEVVIYGKLMNYQNNTPETVSGKAYLYSLNGQTGEGGGSEPVDYEKAEAKTVAEFISAADKNTYYKLTGKVSGFNSEYCSFDLTDDSGKIYVYSVANKADWSSKISNGGTVVLAGKYEYYTAKQQHEVVDAQILSFEEAKTETKDVTVAEAIAAEKDAALKVGPGVVVASASAGFLMEQDGAKIYVYGGSASVGDNVTVEATKDEYGGVAQLKGPKVTVNSKGSQVTYPDAKDITSTFASYSSDSREYVTYTGKLSISNNRYFNVIVEGSTGVTGSFVKPNEDVSSLDGKNVKVTGYYLYTTSSSSGKFLYVIATEVKAEDGSGTGGGEGGGEEPGGETGNIKEVTVAQFLAAEASKTQPYKLTGTVSKITSTKYGNFDLTDDSGTVYVYGLVSKDLGSYDANKKNDQSFESIGIKEGDKITIVGYREDYTDKSGNTTKEVMGAYYVSGASGSGSGGGEGGQGGGEVSGNTITFSDLGISNGAQYNGSGDDKTIVKGTDFTVYFGKGTNDGKYYNTGNAVRTYGSGYIRVASSTKTITKIVYTFQEATGTSGETTFKTYPIEGDNSVSTGSIILKGAVATWTGSASSVNLTRASGVGHWRLQKIEVTFAE